MRVFVSEWQAHTHTTHTHHTVLYQHLYFSHLTVGPFATWVRHVVCMCGMCVIHMMCVACVCVICVMCVVCVRPGALGPKLVRPIIKYVFGGGRPAKRACVEGFIRSVLMKYIFINYNMQKHSRM